MEAKTPDADIGVIIGRFQVPDLHDGHKDLIETVKNKHRKVIIFICSTPGQRGTRRNPLDYFTRSLMIQELYPSVTTLPLHDMPCDRDWSNTVDSKIAETAGDYSSAVLYGSRDAFIPYYYGRHQTVQLDDSINISGTEVRMAASDDVRQHSEFRRGVVYSAFNKHPTAYPTVDIAVIKEGKQIALGRKLNDKKDVWRLPGGFVDPSKDRSIEEAARRELSEEMPGISTAELKYVGSRYVDDWRYKNEVDCVITTLFMTELTWGSLNAGDDLYEVRWFDIENFDMDILIKGHQPLMDLMMRRIKNG